ncbi:serine hydrolase domain-containing protein [Rufibacter aurantiacus]|uniref:serine hydrolase domain-containing protein n=1 Tax=Rufibacter aurantiacus TaxID=2817374 RepID=UPI001B302209|nr:serine hydrolase domain-containing protein [Rufibacter aurantiacus]
MSLPLKSTPSNSFLLILISCLAICLQSQAQHGTTQQIEALLDKAVALHRFNGTALVSKKGKVIFEKAYGFQNIAQRKPNTLNTIYPIGSTTKQFTAVVVLKLVEQGKLSLDDKLSNFFPDFKPGPNITIKQLLSHTSGIFELFRSPEFLQLDKSAPISKEQLQSFYLTKPLDFAPGTQFNYCNSGYHLLGQIIEKVTGQPYEHNVRELVLKPLKMKKSGFDFTGLASENKATSYKLFSKTAQMAAAAWDSTATYAGGALYSTTHDLLLWHKGLQKNKIIEKGSLTLASTPILGGYGLGCWIDSLHHRKIVSHGGNIEGFTSYFGSIREEDMSVILLNNIYNKEIESIGQAIFSIMLGKPYQFFNEVQLPVETLEKYVGQYDVNPNYQVKISRTNHHLFLAINNGTPIEVFADKEHSFYDKNEDFRIKFTGQNGQINQITVIQGLSTKRGDKLVDRI